MIIFTFSTLFCSPLATHMGPIWTRISFYIVFIWAIYVFSRFFYGLGGFINVCLHLLTIFENSIYTFVYHILRIFKDHFARPPAPNFALWCKFDFSIFSENHEHFLVFCLIDFLLYIPRDRFHKEPLPWFQLTRIWKLRFIFNFR